MNIRPLIINDVVKAEAAKVVEYASKHFYIPGESALPPGDIPAHVLNLAFGYRCVFSYTAFQGRIFRDLSVSVSAKGKYPNQQALFTIATELFGFTGWNGGEEPPPPDWMIGKDVHFEAIRTTQET